MKTTGKSIVSEFSVEIGDRNITQDLMPLLVNLRVQISSAAHLDEAEIRFSDEKGAVLPKIGAYSLRIGFRGEDEKASSLLFVGAIDGVRSECNRSGGRHLTISAKSGDLFGRLKERQERHWDETTISEAFAAAAQSVGLTAHVDPELGQLRRGWLAMEGESFLAFGQRLASEIGGTFRVSGGHAVLLARSGGRTASGRELSTIAAVYGENLISWDIAPVAARPRYSQVVVPSYDARAGASSAETLDIPSGGASAKLISGRPAGDPEEARQRAHALLVETARHSGGGEILIAGNQKALPEALCKLSGARTGIDGSYRILAVEHTLARNEGFLTRLQLGEPADGAGSSHRD